MPHDHAHFMLAAMQEAAKGLADGNVAVLARTAVVPMRKCRRFMVPPGMVNGASGTG